MPKYYYTCPIKALYMMKWRKMPKYYYTCPIKALYMMKEFGVKIKQLGNYPALPQEFVDISFEDMRDDILPYFNPRFEKENRLYVCQKSEHIFEPKEGDIIKNDCHDGFHHYQVNWISEIDANNAMYTKTFNGDQWIGNSKLKNNIIMRNNKNFFMPEVKND